MSFISLTASAIRPENIYLHTSPDFYELGQYDGSEGFGRIKQVQLAGLENARLAAQGEDIIDGAYNVNSCQSPEALVRGPVNKPSDMFSFGVLVCSLADHL